MLSMIFLHIHICLLKWVCVYSVIIKLYGMSIPNRKVIKQTYSAVFCVHVVLVMDKLPCGKDLSSKVFWSHEILYSLSQCFSNFPTNFMEHSRQPINLPCFIKLNSSLPFSEELLLLISNHTYRNALHVNKNT